MVEHISKKSANRLKAAEKLGIDEIALKKGHGQYIVVLVNLNKTIAFAKSRR